MQIPSGKSRKMSEDGRKQLENAKLFYEDVAAYLKERLESEE